ncbi:MAG: hypothetical protein ACR2JL_00555, partial [Candidatus Limnocylindrus sp.]
MSIKQKFATAIATAGLLAGIFGSSLVPSVRAADSVISGVSYSSSDSDIEATSGSIYYVIAGASITVDVQFDVSDADGVAVTLTDTGLIKSATPTADVPTPVVAPNGKSVSFGFIDDFGNVDATVVFTAPAAGVTDTISIGGEKLYLVGVAAGVSGKPSATKSWMNTACEPYLAGSGVWDGVDDLANTDIGGGGAPCSDTLYVDASTGWAMFMVHTADAYDNAVTNGYFLYASLSSNAAGLAAVGIDDDPNDDEWCDSENTFDGALADLTLISGDLWVCVASEGYAAKPVTLTVTVGSLTYTRKIGFIGAVASLALTGPSAIASVGTDALDADYDGITPEVWGDAFVVVAKDSAGNIIGNGGGEPMAYDSNGNVKDTKRDYCNSAIADTWGCWNWAANWIDDTEHDGNMGQAGASHWVLDTGDDDGKGISFVVADGAGISLSQFTTNEDGSDSYADSCDEITDEYYTDFNDEGCEVSDGADSYAFAEPANGAYNVPGGLCDENSAGETRKIHVVDNATGVVSSNTITVACVEYDVKLTDVTASGTSV